MTSDEEAGNLGGRDRDSLLQLAHSVGAVEDGRGAWPQHSDVAIDVGLLVIRAPRQSEAARLVPEISESRP
jgi:hypothetical protein